MTAYVDDMRRSARPAGYHGRPARWSHLFADTTAELLDLANLLGLDPAWLQHPGTHREHFDVTDTVRARALLLGAVRITYPRGVGTLMERRRDICRCVSLASCSWSMPVLS